MLSNGAADTVATGALPLATLIALVAGIVSFASPCVLPLVPGFLGYVTGLTGQASRRRVIFGAFLFVLGFTVVLVGIALAIGAIANTVHGHKTLLMQVGGVIVIAMGFMFMGLWGQSGFSRIQSFRPAAGLLGAPLLGAVFALGMSPCIGPVYSTIVASATSLSGDGVTMRSVVLASAYSLGIGLPFIAIAAGFTWVERSSRWLKDKHRIIQIGGGSIMVLIGVCMVAGWWEQMLVWVQTHLTAGFVPGL